MKERSGQIQAMDYVLMQSLMAFDRGLITIDKDFHIINSRYLEEAVMN